jgi:glutaredoxin
MCTLYSTGCPKCKILKKKLDDAGISYEENNSTEDMIRLGIEQVPVLCTDETLLSFGEAVKWIKEYGN